MMWWVNRVRFRRKRPRDVVGKRKQVIDDAMRCDHVIVADCRIEFMRGGVVVSWHWMLIEHPWYVIMFRQVGYFRASYCRNCQFIPDETHKGLKCKLYLGRRDITNYEEAVTWWLRMPWKRLVRIGSDLVIFCLCFQNVLNKSIRW
jgi:hypothetical protein